MSCKRSILLVAATLALGGCASWDPKTGRLDESTFGEAKNATMAAQIVDPDPQYEYLDPATSGEHAAQAIDRYRKGAVKQPERVRSTQTQSGGN
ncbi:hypothetical protein [Novosphingobium sp. Gsoil 351]|uniref:hypothetical protein n=1 Tax=Novosphingobium sp. Gsoil 351 TaxID=2675225 RepID=UPI0012B485B5|nr:hypothetical protein [Novosphingobium sp. Gsoil 351]QGN54468.1 hypothetical protein GKE62_07765 [Novosphingobium sp. Gsoil 351]